MQEQDKDRLYRSYRLERFSICWEIENLFLRHPKKNFIPSHCFYLGSVPSSNQSIWPGKYDVLTGLGLDKSGEILRGPGAAEIIDDL